MRIIPVESDQHWHELRAKTIGSSEVAALFDRSPYTTKFALWHAKAGNVVLREPGDERIDAGKFLEPAIADWVASLMKWTLEARRVYCLHDTIDGMGCTLDRFVVDHEDGPGFVECKNVAWDIFRDQWTATRAPAHIELQVQHQLAVTGYRWAAIAVLVAGNELKIYMRYPDPDVIVPMEDAVAAFWASIAGGRVPNAFGDPSEIPVLAQLNPSVRPTKKLDLTGDPDLAEVVADLAWAQAQRLTHDKLTKAGQARMIAMMGDAALAYVDGFQLKLTKTEMDGHVVGPHIRQVLTVSALKVMPADRGAPPPERAPKITPDYGDASPYN